MTTNVLVTLSGYGGGEISEENAFVAEAFKGIFSSQWWVNPFYHVRDDVFERADVALAKMRTLYDATGSDAAFCIFGNSKGGVVARTLLSRNRETSILPLDAIKCVITHDSPHNGAILPLGYQFFLKWAGESGYLSKAEREELDKSLLSKSAQQLLLYYLIPEKTLEGPLVESADPIAALNAAFDRLYRLQSHHDPVSSPLQPLGIGKKLRKQEHWSISANPHPERVKLMEYLAKYEEKQRWCGPSFNIAVAAGSLGRANTAHGRRILQLNYHKRWPCPYFGYLSISVVPGEKAVILNTDSNVENWVKLPKGVIKLKRQVTAWASGPGSHYDALGKELPGNVLKRIQEKVKNANACAPARADEAFVHSDVAFIPTISALDVRDTDPFALKGLNYAEIVARSALDAVFYPPGNVNRNHGNWQDVVGPEGAKGAAGAYRLVERVFTGAR